MFYSSLLSRYTFDVTFYSILNCHPDTLLMFYSSLNCYPDTLLMLLFITYRLNPQRNILISTLVNREKTLVHKQI